MSPETPDQPPRPAWLPVSEIQGNPFARAADTDSLPNEGPSAPITAEQVQSQPESERATTTPQRTSIFGAAAAQVHPAAPVPSQPNEAPRPVPIDDDDAEIIRPVPAPSAAETFPSAPVTSPYDRGSQDEAEEPQLPPEANDNPFRRLGYSAVANATMSASGAPTPMGGVPMVANPNAATEADAGFEPTAPAFVPRYVPAGGVIPGNQPSLAFNHITSPEHPAYPEPDVGSGPDSGSPHGQELEATPTFFAPVTGDIAVVEIPSEQTVTPWWRSMPALTVYGLAVMAGVAYVLLAMFILPKPVVLAPEILLEGPPGPAVSPVEPEDPTPFLAGLPVRTQLHVLIEVSSPEVRDVDNLPARTAEVHDLVYTDGTDTFTVRALQHYNETEALEAYTALSAGATDLAPVEALEQVVGERAIVETETGSSIVWRNGTAVFTVEGPTDKVLEFYTYFGL